MVEKCKAACAAWLSLHVVCEEGKKGQTCGRRGQGGCVIELDRVAMSYGGGELFGDISLKVQPGSFHFLTGPSGAGKTTIFKALTRLVDPDQGQITIGGVDGRQMGLADLRGLFSTVTQDALLFDETLHENIVLGEDSVAPDRLANVLDAARVRGSFDKDTLDAVEAYLRNPAGWAPGVMV